MSGPTDNDPWRLPPTISIALLFLATCGAAVVHPVPGLSSQCFAKEGHINLGLLLGLGSPTEKTLCSAQFSPTGAFWVSCIEAFIATIEDINRRQDLLPNITLGYAIMDTCFNNRAALAEATYFIPGRYFGADEGDPEGNSTDQFEEGVTDCRTGPRRFKVAGVVGPTSSTSSVLVSSLLGVYHIPVLATLSTSDELSDKARFEYFLRLVSPDRFVVLAIFDMLKYHNWTYVSLLYSEGSYGENAAKWVAKNAKAQGMCFPVIEMFSTGQKLEDMDAILEKMVKNRKARVVLLFLNFPHQIMLFDGIERWHLEGQFLWIAGDYLTGTDYGRPADGALVFQASLVQVPDLVERLGSLTFKDIGINPWLRRLWELKHDCVGTDQRGNDSCATGQDRTLGDVVMCDFAAIYMDGALTYAHAIHRLIEQTCPEAFGNKRLLNTCITGDLLLFFLRNTTFEGVTGRIVFDKNADMLGTYSIVQYVHDRQKKHVEVGQYDTRSHGLTLFFDKLRYDIFKPDENEFEEANFSFSGVPESVCSKPCSVREYIVRLELPCCWECRTCRNNDHIVRNGTDCEVCPDLTWPDELTQSSCENIEPSLLRWTDAPALTLVLLGVLGVLSCLVIFTWLFLNRRVKLIKASSLELTAIILFGTLVAFLSVISFVARPSLLACTLSRCGFNLSVCLIYSPLLVKTNRIYRIFSAGKKGIKKPGFTGNHWQLFFCAIFIVVQVGAVLRGAVLVVYSG